MLERPASGSSTPAIIRSSVVLPEPLGPSSATPSLRLISKLTSRSPQVSRPQPAQAGERRGTTFRCRSKKKRTPRSSAWIEAHSTTLANWRCSWLYTGNEQESTAARATRRVEQLPCGGRMPVEKNVAVALEEGCQWVEPQPLVCPPWICESGTRPAARKKRVRTKLIAEVAEVAKPEAEQRRRVGETEREEVIVTAITSGSQTIARVGATR